VEKRAIARTPERVQHVKRLGMDRKLMLATAMLAVLASPVFAYTQVYTTSDFTSMAQDIAGFFLAGFVQNSAIIVFLVGMSLLALGLGALFGVIGILIAKVKGKW
jgi:hypothetical protein